MKTKELILESLNDYQTITLFKLFDEFMSDWRPEDINGIPHNFSLLRDEKTIEKLKNKTFYSLLRIYTKIYSLERKRKEKYNYGLLDDNTENNIIMSIAEFDDTDKIYYIYCALYHILKERKYNKPEFINSNN